MARIKRNPGRGRGFTLIELLTVAAVIGVLVMMTVPSLARAKVVAKWRLSYSRVMQIDGGCEMYKSDFGSWPMSSRDQTKQDLIDKGITAANAETILTYIPTGLTGKELASLFLTGYAPAGLTGAMTNILTADGQEGFGYRVIQRGQQWGPYGGTDNIETKLTGGTTRRYFVDAFGSPILYYLFVPSTSTSALNNAYNAADNPADGPTQAFLDFCRNYRTSFAVMSKGPHSQWPTLPVGNDVVTDLGIEK
ncbi:MAG: prepilin-type N-terminal cleavage/methylation domain-containing protein [Planctomycetes bacterium]|nr:prepilin-type N-terminal cleavage/methylation domain-containing protein [Planctomycetota bacterium]